MDTGNWSLALFSNTNLVPISISQTTWLKANPKYHCVRGELSQSPQEGFKACIRIMSDIIAMGHYK
eukprot:794276-Pelagomonas_calceolata.AAC.1